MKGHYLFALLICCIGTSLQAANVSCNERMRHGPKGVAKGVVALAGAAGTVYIATELIEAVQPFLETHNYVSSSKKAAAFKNSCITLLALAALGYVTWETGSSSYESLSIFLDDDEDPQVGVKRVIDAGEAQEVKQ